MEVFRKATISQVEDSLDIELKLQTLRNAQTEQMLENYAKHFQRYGHLFAVDKQGNQILDHFGFPVPLKIPYACKGAHELIQGLESRLRCLVEQQRLLEEQKPEEKPKTIDVSDYKHLLTSKKQDGGSKENS